MCGAVAAAAFVVALLNFEILKLFSSVSLSVWYRVDRFWTAVHGSTFIFGFTHLEWMYFILEFHHLLGFSTMVGDLWSCPFIHA